MYQTNTGHRAASLYTESNAQNKVTIKCWSCHVFNIAHQLSSFCALVFAIFSDEDLLTILVLQIFSRNHSPTYLVCYCSPLSSLQPILSRTGHFLHLKHFEASASLCVVNGILLDIGRDLWHSLVLQSQISNFPHSLKRYVSCVKLFSLKNFILSLNVEPKAHYFCFLLLIQRSAFQQKSNKAALPNTKSFFYCKTRVVRTIAMFIASQ